MTNAACRTLHRDVASFVEFKRRLGFKYQRSELALLSFERFALMYCRAHPSARLDQAMVTWISRAPGRKPQTVAFDIHALRQFCGYLRRTSSRSLVNEPVWPPLPSAAKFCPHIFSASQVRRLLCDAAKLGPSDFRGRVFHTLLLVLYCTGLRFGEAVRLRFGDVDLRAGVLYIAESKGRARIVPFHRSLSRELGRYFAERRARGLTAPGDQIFIGTNREPLRLKTASNTVRKLLRDAGFKPLKGRIGPRPYDMRHTFAVHRLTRWYRAGVDLHARLPWLSAYMGHGDILGTETYLTATPELLALAGHRFRKRYLTADGLT